MGNTLKPREPAAKDRQVEPDGWGFLFWIGAGAKELSVNKAPSAQECVEECAHVDSDIRECTPAQQG